MISHKEQVVNYFKSGIKTTNDFKIGIEHEKFLFDKNTNKRATYEIIIKMFTALNEFGWKPIMENQNIIGLKKSGKNITLEPGNQIELSGDQLNNIHEACAESHDYLFELQQVTKKLNLNIVSAGFDPISKLNEVPNNPKQRYEVMTKDMPNGGSLSLDMMYRTCGTQLNLDYSSEEDFVKKFKIINSIVPISIALFANSSIVEKKNSGYMSYRSKVWQDTSRGGLPEIFFDNMDFEKYADFAINFPLLFIQNEKKYLSGKKYSFRKNYLALIGLSNGYTIGTKYNFSYSSKFNSIFKKYIDQKFINKFNNKSSIKTEYILNIINKTFPFLNIKSKYNFIKTNQMQCKGCAAKVPFTALKNTLPENITASSDDASSISNYPQLFQTIDMINAIIPDPFLMGKIAANHSLSDIIAVKSKPIAALMMLQLPFSNVDINSRDLEQVLCGAKEIFDKHNCIINGGHTMIGKDSDPVIGFTVTGESKLKENKNKKSYQIKNNDTLVLTEKIGSGIIFCGINNDMIDSYFQKDVITQMTNGNFLFGNISEKLNILSMTDITGFGLANHLLNLIKRDKNKTGLTIFPEKIPIFNGVKEAIDKGVKSSLFESNYNTAINSIIYDRQKKSIDEILYDPQTVGGLAFIVSKEEKEKQYAILKKHKINFVEIGYVNNLNNQIKIM